MALAAGAFRHDRIVQPLIMAGFLLGIFLDGFQISLSPADTLEIILLIPGICSNDKRYVNAGGRGIRKPFLRHGDPFVQLRQALDLCDPYCTLQQKWPKLHPARSLLGHRRNPAAGIVHKIWLQLTAFDAHQQGTHGLWFLFQLPAEQLHIPLLFFLTLLLVCVGIAVMVKNRMMQNHFCPACRPDFMDSSLVTQVSGHTSEPDSLKVHILRPRLPGVVVAHDHNSRIHYVVAAVAQETRQFRDILIQPLVGVDGKVPLP